MAQDEVAEWLSRWTANPLCSARVGSNPILVGQCLWMWAAIIPNDWRSYMFGHINGQLFCYSIKTKCRKNDTVRLLVSQAGTRRGGRYLQRSAGWTLPNTSEQYLNTSEQGPNTSERGPNKVRTRSEQLLTKSKQVLTQIRTLQTDGAKEPINSYIQQRANQQSSHQANLAADWLNEFLVIPVVCN